MSSDQKHQHRCQVAIIGPQRNRIVKVVSLLTDETSTSFNSEGDDNHVSVDIEYLPCVASFDSYVNDETGETIRYLASVEYHGKDGKQRNGSSIAPFFDNVNDDTDENINFGVIGVAVGSGIESNDDLEKIRSFINMFSGAAQVKESSDTSLSLPVIDIIKPNPEYATMEEETEAFRAMNVEEKAEVTANKTFGPGKMAAFAKKLADRILTQLVGSNKQNKDDDDAPDLVDLSNENNISPEPKEEPSIPSLSPYEIAQTFLSPEDLSSKVHFKCSMCRTPLFTIDHLENPPHTVSKHNFNHKKKPSQAAAASRCESVFISEGLPWMEDITLSMEGRILCPRPACQAKIGSWKWAGTQCSCGTWVTPAIQFPVSKVDRVQPGLSLNVTGNVNNNFSMPMVIRPYVADAGTAQNMS